MEKLNTNNKLKNNKSQFEIKSSKMRFFYATLLISLLSTSTGKIAYSNYIKISSGDDKNEIIDKSKVNKFNKNIDSGIEKINENILYVNVANINIREKPSIKSNIILKLTKGEKIIFTESIKKESIIWKKIIVNQKYYWIAEKNLKTGKNYLSENFESKLEKEKGYSIVVNKSDKKLEVFHNGDLEKRFNISISGYEDDKPKELEGDMKTPEGKYYISYKNKASTFGVNPETGGRLGSLMISYPNIKDAWKGLQNGNISIKEYNKIYTSIIKKGVPPQNTDLGSWIMIHGGGSTGDWTAGCIALDNEDMLWLNKNIKSKVKIEIYK